MRAKRKDRGLSLRETARLIGVSPSYLCDLEFGRRQWSKELRTRVTAVMI